MLTELTSLLGNKANINPNKEKISVTNNEIQKLTEEIKLEKERNQKLAQENTKLLTSQVKQKELEDQVNSLKQELNKRPEKEVVVQPQDYGITKKKLQESEGYYRKLKNDYDEKVKQLNELKAQIKSMTELEPEQQYSKKLKDDTILFCAKVENFMSQVGGLAYLANHINDLPTNEQKAYIKTVGLVEAWASNIKLCCSNK